MAYDYIKAFKAGHEYNKKVANYLNEFGIKCHAPDLKIARNSEEIREMTLTEKDIVLDLVDCVLEVKTSSRSFGWDPSKFPYNDTIVDTVNSYESKIVKPAAYILCSQQTGAMVAIPPSTKDRWRVARFYDKKQELYDDFYLIKKEDIASMTSLIDYLLLRQG